MSDCRLGVSPVNYPDPDPPNFLASKTYIGSVLFRDSAFTGAKLASGVPAVIGHFGP